MPTFVDFRHVKANASFEPVLSHYGITLSGKGNQKAILCPFHKEKTASCKVNIDKKIFHCFGCGAKGNVLDFVAKKEGADLRSAALLLADWCGIDPAPDQQQEEPPSKPATKRQKSPNAATSAPAPRQEPKRGNSSEREAPAASTVVRPLSFSLKLDGAHPYLRERGLTDEAVQMFGLGYCSRGVMTGRIAIPIHDEHGNLVAYAGRWPGEPPEDEPKYRLPDGFEKSRVLFNLHRVPVGTTQVAVVEGFFGAIAMHQLGIPAVACMGSSMSEQQFDLLGARGVEYLKLLFDGDPAGDEASKKLAGEATRRFYVRRVLLPEGHQPDTAAAEASLAGEQPAWLEELLAPPP